MSQLQIPLEVYFDGFNKDSSLEVLKEILKENPAMDSPYKLILVMWIVNKEPDSRNIKFFEEKAFMRPGLGASFRQSIREYINTKEMIELFVEFLEQAKKSSFLDKPKEILMWLSEIIGRNNMDNLLYGIHKKCPELIMESMYHYIPSIYGKQPYSRFQQSCIFINTYYEKVKNNDDDIDEWYAKAKEEIPDGSMFSIECLIDVITNVQEPKFFFNKIFDLFKPNKDQIEDMVKWFIEEIGFSEKHSKKPIKNNPLLLFWLGQKMSE